jgi:L-ascorbate metabolism protein UlaG (beta-lactamase superfamily)
VKIKYLGHASFIITSDTGVRIITDPYETGPDLTYGEITEPADVVTVSHDHFDHCNVAAVKGNPEVVREAVTREVKGIRFKAIPTYHDDAGGRLRGSNTIFCFEMDGIRVCHLGDLGHLLDDGQVAEIGTVDILLIPVGGYYTIDARVASEVCNQLKPRVIIPMHYRTEIGIPRIAGVYDFLRGKERVSRLDTSEAGFKREELPSSTQVLVLKSAL